MREEKKKEEEESDQEASSTIEFAAETLSAIEQTSLSLSAKVQTAPSAVSEEATILAIQELIAHNPSSNDNGSRSPKALTQSESISNNASIYMPKVSPPLLMSRRSSSSSRSF